jgi:hypothetical protein
MDSRKIVHFSLIGSSIFPFRFSGKILPMNKLEQLPENVFNKVEVVAITTAGAEGPHVAATWADFVIVKQADGKDLILIPAGGYRVTEENLMNDPRIQLLIGSKQLPGKGGSGSCYRLSGLSAIETTGANFEAVHTRFSWARAALVIEVQSIDQLL